MPKLMKYIKGRIKQYYERYIKSFMLQQNIFRRNQPFLLNELFGKKIIPFVKHLKRSDVEYLKYLFSKHTDFLSKKHNRKANFFFFWGLSFGKKNIGIIRKALSTKIPVYYIECGWFYNVFSHLHEGKVDKKYNTCLSFLIDDLGFYFDANNVSRLEQMLNDKNLVITDEQKARARNCIDFIVKNKISKFNNASSEYQIKQNGRKKILVIDQNVNDMSILCGMANGDTFSKMITSAIQDNDDADIYIKIHPLSILLHNNHYQSFNSQRVIHITENVNIISLICQMDEVYVCTSQVGFEALMCGKAVHTFGMPFYAGYGLTNDYLINERRTNKRTIEELFYIAYIMYCKYVNPDTQKHCEIEDCLTYLVKNRDEYFNSLKSNN